MTQSNLITEIIHIPRHFDIRNNVSIYDLLSQTGYFTLFRQLSVGDLRAALVLDQACVDEWLAYSENKRCDSGWYFHRTQNGQYVVGYHPAGKKTQVTYDDPFDACADFIIKEIEAIRLA